MNKNLIQETIGNTIKNYRVKKNLTQEDLADKIDFDRTYISMIENGKRNIPLSTIIKISVTLEVKPSQLFEDVDNLDIIL